MRLRQNWIPPLVWAKLTITCLILLCVDVAVLADSGSPFFVEDGTVFALADDRVLWIGDLASNDDPFFGYPETYAVSPDGRSIAFIGETDDSPSLLLLYSGTDELIELPGEGAITWRTRPVWSPASTNIVYSVGDRIWVYDVEDSRGWIVTEPDEPFYEDIEPSFADDGWSIFFYRGTTFEYMFSGELYSVGLDGKGLVYIDEESPRFPGESLGGPELDDPYIATSEYLLNAMVESFVVDLTEGDFRRLFSYFPAWYIVTQLEVMDMVGEPISAEMFDLFLFNGAAMYADYGNVIESVDSIRRVIDYEIWLFENEVHFIAETFDGRTVEFYLLFDQDSLQFIGAFG